MRIIVNEYPKSGGTWLVNLIGDALGLPKGDIYVDNRRRNDPNLRVHPWYADLDNWDIPENCVIKAHEPVDMPAVKFPAKIIHLMRDGRDVIVSRYFYDTDFCVKNGIYSNKDIEASFDAYMPRRTADWSLFVSTWMGQPVYPCFYENLLADTAGTLKNLLEQIGVEVSCGQIDRAIENNTKQKMRAALSGYKHNTFVRKGIAGDWRNYFDEAHKMVFKRLAGDVLIRLGYEKDMDW